MLAACGGQNQALPAPPTNAAPSISSGDTTSQSAASTAPMPKAPITPKPLPAGAKIPTFTGPYAGDFTAAYTASQSDLQRKVLADGTLTAAEMGAVQDAFRTCMTAVGFSDITFNAGGGMGFQAPKGWDDNQVQAMVSACGGPTIDGVDLLYQQLHLNPTHEDSQQLMASCLVRVGLAPAGYTAAQYTQDSPDSYPFSTKDPRFDKCAADPKNAGR